MPINNLNKNIPVIDLFAGPGGLGEGFSKFQHNGENIFKIALSIEKDSNAHSTLRLRSFFRQFSSDKIPEDYYSFLRGEITIEELYKKFPKEYGTAKKEAWHGELGVIDETVLDNRIAEAVRNYENWILIGGPPCQAYSVAGRARNKGISGYIPEKDERHFLYRQYLRIIARHWPSVFIMENVRGILSSKIKGQRIFPKILKDLKNPASVFNGLGNNKKYRYRIFSLVEKPDGFTIGKNPIYKNPSAYTIKCEEYGIPQARHRVILMGIREDSCTPPYPILKKSKPVGVKKVIGGLPRLRSGFSRGQDSKKKWMDWLDKIVDEAWYDKLKIDPELTDVAEQIFNMNLDLRSPRKDRGAEFIPCKVKTDYLKNWYHDEQISGVCNSTTRTHLESDLYRYFYAACFAMVRKRSPLLVEFPEELLPNHKSVKRAIKTNSLFSDRFRVQLASQPSTTIMSHISKDGHYYIHPDPTQCRSLTVREAARLQTFPDNYFFCGFRTNQYVQVGNAVPPYLAYQIADIVNQIILKNTGKLNGQAYERKTQLEHVTDKREGYET